MFISFQTNENFHRATYNIARMAFCIYCGVTNYDFQNILLNRFCALVNSALCGLSSGSSLFAKLPIKGFLVNKVLTRMIILILTQCGDDLPK